MANSDGSWSPSLFANPSAREFPGDCEEVSGESCGVAIGTGWLNPRVGFQGVDDVARDGDRLALRQRCPRCSLVRLRDAMRNSLVPILARALPDVPPRAVAAPLLLVDRRSALRSHDVEHGKKQVELLMFEPETAIANSNLLHAILLLLYCYLCFQRKIRRTSHFELHRSIDQQYTQQT